MTTDMNASPLGGCREDFLTRLQSELQWDAIVVGGGITGVGVAREMARYGLKVLLVEQKDFAWGTSSRSSKMVHGGLRYLAQGKIGLTRESVRERQRLLQEAPGLVDDAHFVMAHYTGQSPSATAFGLLMSVYSGLAGQKLHHYQDENKLSTKEIPGINEQNLQGATVFSDAIVDDARLVLRVLYEAVADGALALNYCPVTALVKNDVGTVTGVRVKPLSVQGCEGSELQLQAKVVINATGVWTDRLRADVDQPPIVRPLRGSHLVIPHWRLPLAQACCFMHPDDNRPVFVYAWEGHSVIGTTDVDHTGELDQEPSVSQDEVNYLLKAANHQFPGAKLKENDVISSWSGVRPVISSGKNLAPSKEAREHDIWDDKGLITICGGKLTTFRVIAQQALEKASTYLPQLKDHNVDEPVFACNQSLSETCRLSLDVSSRRRIEGRLGSWCTPAVMMAKKNECERVLQTDCLWFELRWACCHELVMHLDDLLLRRTRLGNLLPEGGMDYIDRIRDIVQQELGWDDIRWEGELKRYRKIWKEFYSLPVN